jgi:hypothetical protein
MPKNSISIGGNVTGASIVAGDRNVVTTTYTKAVLPAPETADIAREVAAIQALLVGLAGEHATRLANATAEASEEAARPEPDRDEIGKALGRALDYAQKTNGFAEQVEKLAPHVAAACGWLGANWHWLLAKVGLGT